MPKMNVTRKTVAKKKAAPKPKAVKEADPKPKMVAKKVAPKPTRKVKVAKKKKENVQTKLRDLVRKHKTITVEKIMQSTGLSRPHVHARMAMLNGCKRPENHVSVSYDRKKQKFTVNR
jgi:hypothetical protein